MRKCDAAEVKWGEKYSDGDDEILVDQVIDSDEDTHVAHVVRKVMGENIR